MTTKRTFRRKKIIKQQSFLHKMIKHQIFNDKNLNI